MNSNDLIYIVHCYYDFFDAGSTKIRNLEEGEVVDRTQTQSKDISKKQLIYIK